MSEEKYTVSNCSVCTHASRDEIEEKLMGGLQSQKDICAKFSISEPSLSNHKNKHMLSNMKDQLKAIIFQRIKDNQLKDASFSEVIATLKYIEESDKNISITPLRSIEDTLSEFLGMEGEFKDAQCWEYIMIIPDEYEKFSEFMKNIKEDIHICVCPSAYKKFKENKI